ncbi:MAG: opioid growth factor receptor-related protein [Gemmatimonadaceae bacterium]
MEPPADPVVRFYSGGTDHRGRTVVQILEWPDDTLEVVHDYIQWLFPTIAPSAVNRHAPLVTPATVAAFSGRLELRDALRLSLDRMLTFYGLCRQTAARPVRIAMDEGRIQNRVEQWLWPGDHNHLRLTRIMQSLASLGLPEEASALQRCLLSDIADGPGRDRITPDTLDHWSQALRPRGGR